MAKNGLWVIILGLGLAACSGGGTPTAGTGAPDPGTGGDTDQPAEPTPEAVSQAENQLADARRAAEAAEEQLRAAPEAQRATATLRLAAARADVTSLTARVNLERARAAVQGAEALAQGATTPEERSAALTRLQAAEAQLSAMVEVAERGLQQAEAALAADGADDAGAEARTAAQTALGRATRILVQARAFRISASTQIAAARLLVAAAPAPGTETGGDAGPAGTAAVVRHARAGADGTALAESVRLEIATAAVPYTDGKRVIAADRSGSDELPLRDLTLRIGTTTAGDVKIQGRDGTETTYTETDGVPISSINLGSDRVVYKFGGAGVAFHDTQRRFDIGSTKDAWKDLGADLRTGTTDDNNCWQSDLAQCSAWNSDDLEITWEAGLSGGRNSLNGEPVYYWSSRVPFPEGQSASHPNLLPTFQNGRNDWDLGFYELWVTNHGGYDRNLEPAAGKGQRDRSDDVARYLSYAAYGMFVHTDTLTDYFLPSRVQAFHFGYDAFEDKEDRKTTDISTPVNVRFDGRTMGFMHQHFSNPHPQRVDIRGEVVLNARIGSGANTISGEVTSLEKLSPEGQWVRFDRAVNIRTASDPAERLVFASDEDFDLNGQDFAANGAPIGADGSYKGGVYLQYWDSSDSTWKPKTWNFDPSGNGNTYSEFGGTLYGPTGNGLADLETAGYWYLQGDRRDQRWGGIVASFGAAGTAQAN